MLNRVGSGHRPNLGIFDKYVQGLKDLATHKVLFSAILTYTKCDTEIKGFPKKMWYIQAHCTS
jgi:hypothetical protein